LVRSYGAPPQISVRNRGAALQAQVHRMLWVLEGDQCRSLGQDCRCTMLVETPAPIAGCCIVVLMNERLVVTLSKLKIYAAEATVCSAVSREGVTYWLCSRLMKLSGHK
jgi:hypothetical protein